MNKYLNLYFQVHQPRRLAQFSFFDIGGESNYFDAALDESIITRVANHCYVPANQLLLKLIGRHPNIRITFTISGMALTQLKAFAPQALQTFQMLADTGAVEFLAETTHHSLSSLLSEDEFRCQVQNHKRLVNELFGVNPTIFRNTELIYNDKIGSVVSNMGFKGIFTEGTDRILSDKRRNQLYQHPQSDIKLFLRHYRLSDDIAFRVMERNWSGWPLTPEKYIGWLDAALKSNEFISLGLDYETFGEHHKASSGIFNFLERLLTQLAKHRHIAMINPTEAIVNLDAIDTLSIPESISWADEDRDLSAWMKNAMQREAFETLKKLEQRVKKISDPYFLNTWRDLQSSDHLYYMSTKTGNDGNVHNYFSPYPSPYLAFINFMNVINDFKLKLKNQEQKLTLKDAIAYRGDQKEETQDSIWTPEALVF